MFHLLTTTMPSSSDDSQAQSCCVVARTEASVDLGLKAALR
jgi:hypothetical protein